jgi:hypothetical protein
MPSALEYVRQAVMAKKIGVAMSGGEGHQRVGRRQVCSDTLGFRLRVQKKSEQGVEIPCSLDLS